MKRQSYKTERLHALDSLRAAMMLLGLVLHSALTYNITSYGDAWPLRDPETRHIFSDLIVYVIHSFRMPIFFLIAGFFGAMLFYERQARLMIKNRLSRIVYPFIIFLFILWPFIVLSFGYTSAVFANQEYPITTTLKSLSSFSDFLPRTTAHLWFLYYLIMTTAFTITLAIILNKFKGITYIISSSFEWIIKRPLARIIALSGLTYLLLCILDTAMVEVSISLIPDLNTFVYFLYFYLLGWLLYKSKKNLDSLIRYAWTSTILALVLLIVHGEIIQKSGLAPDTNIREFITYSALVISLFLLGITGLFIRYGSVYSAKIRYLSDSSYWVYLIHLPIVAFLPAFLGNLAIPAFTKFLIVLLTATLICFISYHYLVRNTFIGKFLNGRKYSITRLIKLNK